MARRSRVPAALAVIAVAIFAGWLARALSPYQGYSGGHVVIVIPQGASGRTVADVLHDSGVIRSRGMFALLMMLSGSAANLHAGEYRFEGPMSPLAVHVRLVEGQVVLHPVTVPEGLHMEQIFELFVSRGLGTLEGFRHASLNVGMLQGHDALAEDLEGYLYPDTYRVPRGLSEEEILQGMVRRFLSVFAEEQVAEARALGLTTRQVVTLASMVEREVSVDDERRLVSSVFQNRLERGMLLQCDPTVIYALVRSGDYRGRLTRDDLAFDSPYNTYVHPGIPPGPIASPGRESLHAVLHPAETDYLYFVSMNTGRHHFSRSLAEHQKAVNRYQRNGRGR
jgi:UPF0755 protein